MRLDGIGGQSGPQGQEEWLHCVGLHGDHQKVVCGSGLQLLPVLKLTIIIIIIIITGHAVVQLVQALSYKRVGSGFEIR
jgi:hypothetical protein